MDDDDFHVNNRNLDPKLFLSTTPHGSAFLFFVDLDLSRAVHIVN